MHTKRVRSYKHLKSARGVTLFEVMIALALFAIIITPVMRSFLTAIKVNKNSRETMYATDVANTIMEGIAGKSYEEVVTDLIAADSGGWDADQRRFSSIDENYYNEGNTPPNIPSSAATLPQKYNNCTFPVYGLSLGSDNKVSGTISGLDQLMAKNAITDLVGKSAGAVPGDAKADKLLYFGFLSGDLNRWADPDPTNGKYGVPKAAYMLYSRIEKYNCYFDAIVTFVPRPQNDPARGSRPSGDLDEFLSYEVTVSVYEYYYDVKSGAFVQRFNATNDGFDGSASAVLTGGIINKSIQSQP